LFLSLAPFPHSGGPGGGPVRPFSFEHRGFWAGSGQAAPQSSRTWICIFPGPHRSAGWGTLKLAWLLQLSAYAGLVTESRLITEAGYLKLGLVTEAGCRFGLLPSTHGRSQSSHVLGFAASRFVFLHRSYKRRHPGAWREGSDFTIYYGREFLLGLSHLFSGSFSPSLGHPFSCTLVS
jgi:hypothetical protein